MFEYKAEMLKHDMTRGTTARNVEEMVNKYAADGWRLVSSSASFASMGPREVLLIFEREQKE